MKRLIVLTLWYVCFMNSMIGNYAVLDTSFAGTGYALLNQSGWTNQNQTCSIMQPDGKVIVAGYATTTGGNLQLVICRFTTNGLLDSTFNAAGTPASSYSSGIAATPGYLVYSIPGNYLATPPSNSTLSKLYAINLQADGAILVAGTVVISNINCLFIAKFNADGTLATNLFGLASSPGITNNNGSNATTIQIIIGSPGSTTYNFDNSAFWYTIKQDLNNGLEKILAAGQLNNNIPVVARFLPSGAFDTIANGGSGFGNQGANNALIYLSAPSNSSGAANNSLIKNLAIDSLGYIYMSGQFNPNTGSVASHYPAVFQIPSTGAAVNPNYGTLLYPSQYGNTYGAVMSTNTTVVQGCFNDIVIQKNGYAVAIGTISVNNGANYYMGIARFTKSGQLDTNFGNGSGYVINQNFSTGTGICINENQQLIVTGQLVAPYSSYAGVARYNFDGSLDMNFGPGGYLGFQNLPYSSITLGNDITVDGKIHFGATMQGQFAALQLLGSNQLISTIPSIALYGYNSNFFAEFLYITSYAQIITDLAAQQTAITAVNNLLVTYANKYAVQPNFNFLTYLYLLLPDLEPLQANIIAEYPSSAAEILEFFQSLTYRVTQLSALQS